MNNIVPRIHYGGDFKELVTQSTIFTDKSLFIKEILDDLSKVILITMPRRWGKSVNMDMLKRFLEIKVDENGNALRNEDRVNEVSYKLFAGGEVDYGIEGKRQYQSMNISAATITSKNTGQEISVMSLQGQYPVIYIDLKDCKGSSYEEVESKIRIQLNKCFKQHQYLQYSLKLSKEQNNIIKQYVGELSSLSLKLNQIQDGLRFLSEMLYKHFGVKSYVLVDEYDAAINIVN